MKNQLPDQIREEINRGEMDPILLQKYSFEKNRRGVIQGHALRQITETRKVREEQRRYRRVRGVYRSHVGHRDPEKFTQCPECKLAIADRTKRDIYYKRVWEITEKSFRTSFNLINPQGVARGSAWHLDHKFSISEGFRQNVLPEIIGSHHNLQMLERDINLKKRDDCWVSLDELTQQYSS